MLPELINDTLTLRLNVSPEGIPIIEQATLKATGKVAFRDMGTPGGLGAWVQASLIPATQAATPVWKITEGDVFTTAEATCELAKKMRLTWIVELPDQEQIFRLRIRLTNRGKKARAVDWFPAWSASWNAGEPRQWARWWQALEYTRVEQALEAGDKIRLGSRLHSSDDLDGGINPYWVVGGDNSRIYFGLQWCGGWSARINGLDNGFNFSARLPVEETQLVLDRDEMIEGPALLVTPMTGGDDSEGRAIWMRQRVALGQLLYGGPEPSFPLSYNSWYAVRRKVNDTFLNRQVAAMSPYGFDAFVIDAGWFAEGRWEPDPAKFKPDEMADMLAALKAGGVRAGLWSAPQYVANAGGASALTVEQPPVSNRFVAGYLVDRSTSGFVEHMADHVRRLRENYSIDYWKYDQAFFTEQSLAGAMKNILGVERALQAVRQANADLFIENCQSGGRMINEFTLLLTQTSWLKDGGITGLEHARLNINGALNAMEFVFPWAALRFINNLDRMDPNDDELTRLYCRSAMAGTWGISADLSLVSQRQQNIILKEIKNYRRLNPMKYSAIYDLQLPNESADVAGMTFYGDSRLNAGVLLYRWQRGGAFDQRVGLTRLKSGVTYRVMDADAGAETIALGSELMSNGVTVSFGDDRLSALLFVEAVKNSSAY
jgi:hypothetical protein